MAFDCTDFEPPPPPPPPREPDPRAPRAAPKVTKRDEAVLLGLLVILAFGLLVVPISAASLVDLAHWLRRG